MVLASHVIFSAYGFWLPNDPRGSGSDFIRSWELFRYGPASKTNERRSVAAKPHSREGRLAAKEALKYPPVSFSDTQILTIAEGFATSLRKGNVTAWACAIMPDHVHMVLARHRCPAEKLMGFLKGEASIALFKQNQHPFQAYQKVDDSVSCWGHRGWKVFLDSVEAIMRSIRYVEQNPLKEGRPAQVWPFVTKFDGLV